MQHPVEREYHCGGDYWLKSLNTDAGKPKIEFRKDFSIARLSQTYEAAKDL